MTKRLLAALIMVAIAAPFATAQDVREAAKKAEADRAAAVQRARDIEQKVINDRDALRAEVAELEGRQSTLEDELAALQRRIANNEKKLEQLEDEWARKELEFKEISGNVRVVARDLESVLIQSSLSAISPDRIERLQPLLQKGYFPDIEDISAMAEAMFDEIERSGQVGLVEASYVGRDGRERTGEILTLGKFTAAYKDADEVGFLDYKPDQRRFVALSVLPPRGLARALTKYFAGASSSVPIDISMGGALRQITYEPNRLEPLQAGGPIVWPIVAIAFAVLLIVIYKIFYLNRVHGNTDKIMGTVNEMAARGDWQACKELVRSHKGKNWPVVNVIRDGLAARKEDRETIESVLHESILRELPRLEKGLAVLAIFGAVAPLLGLLGTVTGMIDTFRVITLFGTGDPKLMSGGISEALVTTELGLAVAIPTMLLHTFLSRRVHSIVGDMEEKAVTLTNIIHKEQKQKKQESDDGSVLASA